MHGYFDFETVIERSRRRLLVVFCATSTPQIEDVQDVVRKRLDSSLSPDSIVLLGFESERSILEPIANERGLLDYLPLHMRDDTSSVRAEFIPRNGIKDNYLIGSDNWIAIKQAGLNKIFKSRNTLLIAPLTHHYAKPSGRHSDIFIRVANAAVDGAEITFIAACCLPVVPDHLRHIYCDTGGISVVAFAIDSLRRRFNRECSPATVSTFESYGGIDEFEFRECEESIVLISASTSDSLAQRLISHQRRLSADRIITLFGYSIDGRNSQVIHDLSSDDELSRALQESKSYRQESCPLCKQGSLAVPILGDQFIPVSAVTRSVLLRKREHTPPWLPKFLERMSGKQLLRAFYRSAGTLHASNDVFIDLERALAQPDLASDFLGRVDRLFNQSAPAATRRLIHLDDHASELLADRFTGYLRKICADPHQFQTVAASGLERLEPLDDGASLVIAGAVASGHSLIAVSQKLRGLQRNGAISYLVALTRTESADTLKSLEIDLRMGEKPSYYSFFAADNIFLSLVGRSATCVWDEELCLLQELSDDSDGSTREALERRIGHLREAQSIEHRGLCDNLFWPDRNEDQLLLRHGFVFFPESVAVGSASQGDVFFAIAAVLHNVRTYKGAKSELRQTEHARVVLSPVCFDRFSDGIIQAALLRAAKKPELDYRSAPEQSLRMASILRAIFASAKSPKGEASREFLIALALRRLVLATEDLNSLVKEHLPKEMDPISRCLWDYIGKRLLPSQR